MQPQKLLNSLLRMQLTANKLTLASSAVSHSIGNLIKYIGSEEDPSELPEYVSDLSEHINSLCTQLLNCSRAMNSFCDDAESLEEGFKFE